MWPFVVCVVVCVVCRSLLWWGVKQAPKGRISFLGRELPYAAREFGVNPKKEWPYRPPRPGVTNPAGHAADRGYMHTMQSKIGRSEVDRRLRIA